MNKHLVLTSETKPKTPSIDLDRIPDFLKRLTIWVVWNWVYKNGKWTKPPANGCKSNDPSTCFTFEEALAPYYRDEVDGIGVLLTNGLCGIDLDDCIVNGQLSELARDIIKTVNGYHEVSPSGTGIKILCLAEKPEGSSQNPAGTVEIYDSGRYFTITGHDAGGNIEDRQAEVDEVYAKYVKLPDHPALREMLKHKPHGPENDGSKRLLCVCIRAVEHNLSEDEAVRLIRIYETQFPFPKRWRDSDIAARLGQAEDRDDVVRGSAKPKVVLSDDRIPAAIEETISHVAGADVFQKKGMLVRIRDGEISPVPASGMLELLTSVVQFDRFKAKGNIPCRPDKDFRAAIHGRGHYPGIPNIDRVVRHPILLPSGETVAEPGYNEETQLFLDYDASSPSKFPVAAAVEVLKDIYCDFPWRSGSDITGIIAISLTMLVRHLIDGSTPLFAVDGNRSGCGKGYATEVALMIATGKVVSRYSGGTKNGEELRKYLTSSALAGSPCILFDNVRGRFGGPTLEGAITSGSISDRLLGASKIVDLPLNVVWTLTANDVVYTEDMPRRVCPIFMDTELERPEERQDFKYSNLKSYVQKSRGSLCMAALSIVSEYITAGKPDQKLSHFGGFEAWSDLVRGALVWAGMDDPLAHRDQLFESAVSASPIAKRLIDAWTFDNPITTKQLVEQVRTDPAKHQRLYDILESKPADKKDTEHIGKLLRSAKGLKYGNRRIANDGKSRLGWFVETIAD